MYRYIAVDWVLSGGTWTLQQLLGGKAEEGRK